MSTSKLISFLDWIDRVFAREDELPGGGWVSVPNVRPVDATEPKYVSREQVTAAINGLGFDTKGLVRLEINGTTMTVEQTFTEDGYTRRTTTYHLRHSTNVGAGQTRVKGVDQ